MSTAAEKQFGDYARLPPGYIDGAHPHVIVPVHTGKASFRIEPSIGLNRQYHILFPGNLNYNLDTSVYIKYMNKPPKNERNQVQVYIKTIRDQRSQYNRYTGR